MGGAVAKAAPVVDLRVLHVTLEELPPDGGAVPTGGTIAVYEPPSGPGVRVEGFGDAGYRTSPYFDRLLAKVIVRTTAAPYAAAVARARRARADFRIVGVDVNLGFLQSMLAQPDVAADRVTTTWLDRHAGAILDAIAPCPPKRRLRLPGQRMALRPRLEPSRFQCRCRASWWRWTWP